MAITTFIGWNIGWTITSDVVTLSPELLLSAYAQGVFPMAESANDADLFWVDPRERGVMPLDGFHISRSLAKTIRQGRYQVRVNGDFAAVVAGCADRDETWINAPLTELYNALHAMGQAQSLEIWEGDTLIGGVFGITLGGAFFGESMFSRQTNASKLALAYLVDRLRQGGFTLFDTQFITPHLRSLGGQEIPRAEYRTQLSRALKQSADFRRAGPIPTPGQLLQRRAHTS